MFSEIFVCHEFHHFASFSSPTYSRLAFPFTPPLSSCSSSCRKLLHSASFCPSFCPASYSVRLLSPTLTFVLPRILSPCHKVQFHFVRHCVYLCLYNSLSVTLPYWSYQRPSSWLSLLYVGHPGCHISLPALFPIAPDSHYSIDWCIFAVILV